MSGPIVTAGNVDLSNCDREQIQFSGAVQPHGCMLVIEVPALRVVQASANTGALTGIPVEQLRGGHLDQVLGARTQSFAQQLARAALDNDPLHLACLKPEETAS